MSDDITQKDLISTISVEYIETAKLQQWRTTCYALILMAGIFCIRTYYQLHYYWDTASTVAIFIIAFVASISLYKIEKAILKYRKKIVSMFPIPLHKSGFFLIQITTILIAVFILSFIPLTLKG
jgi:hypothetical protein